MSKRIKLKEHLHSLDEISNIMTAMKNLALIEINKIARFIAMQERVTQTVKAAGRDFLSSYPNLLTRIQSDKPSIYILIGSERGFCAGFNDNIMHKLSLIKQSQSVEQPKLIVVGRKLAMKLAGDERVTQVLDGANSAEEIPDVIFKLVQSVEQISSTIDRTTAFSLIGFIFNEESENHIEVTTLQPFLEFSEEKKPVYSLPPILNISDNKLFSAFSEHYLFSLLYSIFYNSFFAESNQRLHHLDNALDRLDKQKVSLTHNINMIRQEEITEEIEIIMLSAEAIMKELDVDKLQDGTRKTKI